jgi:hypothetical protein
MLCHLCLNVNHRYWLRSGDPAVDERLFGIATSAQALVYRRFRTEAQTRVMHAMAVSATGASRPGFPPRLAPAQHEGPEASDVRSSSPGSTSESDHDSAARGHHGRHAGDTAVVTETQGAVPAAGARTVTSKATGSRLGLEPEGAWMVDGVREIAAASTVLIRLGHPHCFAEIANLVRYLVRVRFAFVLLVCWSCCAFKLLCFADAFIAE